MQTALGCLFVKDNLQLGMKSWAEKIGDQIRSARRRRIPEVSIEDLAGMSGLSRQTISAIENGKQPKVSALSLNKIAQALAIPLSELFGESSYYQASVAEDPAKYHGDIDEQLRRGHEELKKRLPLHQRKKSA